MNRVLFLLRSLSHVGRLLCSPLPKYTSHSLLCRFLVSLCFVQGVGVSDMDSDQWLELLEVVTDDMQAAPQLGKAAASFPLAPAAKGKTGKVYQHLVLGSAVSCHLDPHT